MSRVLLLLFASLLLVATGASADDVERRACGVFHFVRLAGGTEIGTGSITFRNTDLERPATVTRLTIRDFFGVVAHDSGPAIGVPHPLNTDIVPAQDVTVVPPGASYYLSTNHIWGNNPVPGDPSRGNNMMAIVEFEFDGDGKPGLVVSSAVRVRERVPSPVGPQQGAERTRGGATLCAELKK